MPSNSDLPSLHQREEEEEKEDDEVDEEDESCPICFSEFDTCLHPPSDLPCGHTFCLPCLLHPSLATRGHIHCPLCRQPSSLPQTTHTTTHHLNSNTHLWTAPRVISAPSVSRPPAQTDRQTSEFNIRPPRRFPSHPAGISVVLPEGWLEGRCALCCRPLSHGPFPLHCGHYLCQRCLGLLLALASPGWVSFLYCPQCQGQTSVVRGHTSHLTPTVPTLPTSNNPPNTPSSSTSSSASPPLSPVSHPSTPSLPLQASVPMRGGGDGQDRGNGGCGCGGRVICVLL